MGCYWAGPLPVPVSDVYLYHCGQLLLIASVVHPPGSAASIHLLLLRLRQPAIAAGHLESNAGCAA